MPAALLAFLLLAATVDPRLAEPLRLLAQVRDAAGVPVGAFYARVPDALSLRLRIGTLPEGLYGRYDHVRRTVTVAEALADEDPRVVAVVLAHELRHAADEEYAAGGLLVLDCPEHEARAFEVEAQVARAFWPEVLPDGTDAERDLAAIVETYEAGGATGLQDMVDRDGDCTARPPDSGVGRVAPAPAGPSGVD